MSETNQIKLDDLDFLYIYNHEIDWENNRINFQITFEAQKELSSYIKEFDKCHGDMKILLQKDDQIRVSIDNSLVKQDWENLLKVNFYGFILKNAKW